MKRVTSIFLSIILALFLLTSCKKKYIVQFDFNGGNASYTSVEVEKDGTINHLDIPTREGYVFKGFELNGSAFDFSTKIHSNITLVAKWSKLYAVDFETSGGTAIPQTTVEEGLTIFMPTSPTKENATFEGWYLNNEIFDFNTPITSDITLIAKWINRYVVSFDTDGGSLITPRYVNENQLVSQPVSPTKENAIFEGWYLNNEIFDFNTPITSNITLVAKWKNKYIVTFDTNGGSILPSKSIESGQLLIRPGNPTKENSIFLGWYIGEEVFDFNTPITENITLVAKWKDKYHQVEFDTACDVIIENQVVEDGKQVSQPINPVRTNYTFLGWYIGEEVFDFNTPITEDIILVAKWREDYKVVIHFNNGEEDLLVYAKENQPLSTILSMDTPVYEGYEFVDYCLDEELTIHIYNYNKPIQSDMDIYVLWSKYYYITYHLDGGVCEELIEKYTFNDTQNVALKLKTPTKEGYYFRGYYENSDFSGERFYQLEKGVVSDYELYAKWEVANLENAYIGFLGDSITTYKGYIPNGYDYFYYDTLYNVSQTWWKMTQEELGCRLGINNSYSGTCVLKKYGNGSNSGETIARLEKCLRYDQIVPDILVVYMGMNDCLVDPKDVTVSEFRTSYENMINNIYMLYPNVKLFVCTLGFDVYYQNKSNLEDHLTQKEEFNKVITEIANEKNIPLIDFANAYHSQDYLLDTVHPNNLGMIELSKLAVEAIKKFFNETSV